MLSEYRGLIIRPVSAESLFDYLELFKVSFPSFKTSVEYLDWLYFQNPNGSAVGFDAYDGSTLVAHYVCVPIWIDLFQKPSLLALNTATHPKYQGRGLLKVLANKTYEEFGSEYACVVGVANANAIKPLTKYLGFEHLGDLELRLGALYSGSTGRRVYTQEEALWRADCPKKKLRKIFYREGYVKFTRRIYGVLPVSAICPLRQEELRLIGSRRFGKQIGVTLDWRRNHKPKLFLPKKFKPSPLSFVFRPLSELDSSTLTAWTFPDFDAL